MTSHSEEQAHTISTPVSQVGEPTPGPWEWSEVGLVSKDSRFSHSPVFTPYSWPSTNNKRLIAAAPDMLAALREIMADTVNLEPAYCADLLPETRELIRAAIAKATGDR